MNKNNCPYCGAPYKKTTTHNVCEFCGNALKATKNNQENLSNFKNTLNVASFDQSYLEELDDKKRAIFQNKFEQRKKYVVIYVLLALFLGGFGLHKFYLEKYKSGIIYFILSWTYIPSIIAIIEAFGAGDTIRLYNKKIEQEIYQEVSM